MIMLEIMELSPKKTLYIKAFYYFCLCIDKRLILVYMFSTLTIL